MRPESGQTKSELAKQTNQVVSWRFECVALVNQPVHGWHQHVRDMTVHLKQLDWLKDMSAEEQGQPHRALLLLFNFLGCQIRFKKKKLLKNDVCEN